MIAAASGQPICKSLCNYWVRNFESEVRSARFSYCVLLLLSVSTVHAPDFRQLDGST